MNVALLVLRVIVGGLFVGLMQAKGWIPGGILVWLLGTIVMGFVAWIPNHLALKGGEQVVTSIYVPSGETTAYVPTFSHIEALEIRDVRVVNFLPGLLLAPLLVALVQLMGLG